MTEKNKKEFEGLGGYELSNLGVDDDIADEKLKELSETSSQMIEKIKEFCVSEEENYQVDNIGDVLSKSGDNEVNNMKDDHEVSKEGKTTRRKT